MSTLFLIGINDIIFNFKPLIKAQLFADDITITYSRKNVHSINEHLQAAINSLQNWLKTIGLHFSPQKNQDILFTRKNKLQLPPKLHLSDIEIKFTDTIKILGLIFDENISWMLYLKSLKYFCIKTLNIIKILSNNNWGADKGTLLETYKMLIRSRLDYGCTVYNSKTTLKKKVESSSHTALRLATGAYRTCPKKIL